MDIFSSNWLLVWKYCQDLHHTLENSGMGPAWQAGWGMRCKLNLLVGSPVTVAYGLFVMVMELKLEMDGHSVSSAEGSE